MAKNIQFELRPEVFDNFKTILNLVRDNKVELGLDREALQKLGSVRDELDRAYYSAKSASPTKTLDFTGD